jgi:N-acetylneuraminic acid mutarotase
VFQNVGPNNGNPIKVIDPHLKRLFNLPLIKPGKGENKFSVTRFNYAIATFDNKVYFHGGMDENNEVLSSMDEFCAMTYKAKAVEYRLKTTITARRGHAMIALDKFNMFAFGGTQSSEFFDPKPIEPREAVYSFDIEATTWHARSQSRPTQPSDPMPWNMVYHSLFKVDS